MEFHPSLTPFPDTNVSNALQFIQNQRVQVRNLSKTNPVDTTSALAPCDERHCSTPARSTGTHIGKYATVPAPAWRGRLALGARGRRGHVVSFAV